MEQFGGLKLKCEKNTQIKRGFQPVFDMIDKSDSKLTVLTYESLKGFLISLNTTENDSEYIGLNNGRFSQPVTSFILKFAVITNTNDESLTDYKHVDKSSESELSYFNEAKLQQLIWKKSIAGGRPEICPPVGNFSLFDNANSELLCKRLMHKTSNVTDTNVNDIFKYLYDDVTKDNTHGIGVILMPTVVNSVTFGDFLNLRDGTQFNGVTKNNDTTNAAYSHVTAQIARLFVDVGVIHFDLHSGNALIYTSPNNEIKSLIIDFGRASNIMSNDNDEYLTALDKKIFVDNKTDDLNKLLKYDPDINKQLFILNVLDYIAHTDFKRNQSIFMFADKTRYQMDWYRNYPRDSIVTANAFDILKNSTIVPTPSRLNVDTLTNYENTGLLVNFGNEIGHFKVNVLNLAPSIFNSCTIMGGKNKKSRKTKKKRKNKIKKKIKTKKKM